MARSRARARAHACIYDTHIQTSVWLIITRAAWLCYILAGRVYYSRLKIQRFRNAHATNYELRIRGRVRNVDEKKYLLVWFSIFFGWGFTSFYWFEKSFENTFLRLFNNFLLQPRFLFVYDFCILYVVAPKQWNINLNNRISAILREISLTRKKILSITRNVTLSMNFHK